MYAYRPAIGVAVCKRVEQWLLVEVYHQESELELISEKSSLLFAERLGLINMPKVFGDFNQMKAFLTDEYLAAAKASKGEAPLEQVETSVQELLDFMDQSTILKMIHELKGERGGENNPRKAIELLEAIEAHPKYMADIVILAELNPLKQYFKGILGRNSMEVRPTLGDMLAVENCYNELNGSSFETLNKLKQSFQNLAAA